ncbi:MAG: hypothetical protein GVY08_12230 [Bacteroidetes bacterium]|jgi:TrmH family RNA methyltransferase|nr:hypothetical protein [Bacteroidota bacterium]
MQIRPATNNQLKLWRKLQQTKYRKKEGLFLAEGERCVEQIVANGFINVNAFVVEIGYQPGFEINGSVFEVSHDDFESLSDTDTPQGILAVCDTPAESSVAQIIDGSGVIIALDAVQDPGNVGTMIRTSAWFGAAWMLYGDGTADPFHPKVVRSTAGATGVLPFLKGDLGERLKQFEQNGWQIYLMDGGEGSVPIGREIPARRSVLVIGNEGNGIAHQLFTAQRKRVRIPGESSIVESLNAAMAMGIGMYHMTSEGDKS